MPLLGRENVRHATLLFCAEGVTVRTTGAGEGNKEMHIIQFIHPGKEFPVGDTNSDRRPDSRYNVHWNMKNHHHRRLVKHNGRYVDTNGVLHEGDLLFWTEWEGCTTAKRLESQNGLINAHYLHEVVYPVYANRRNGATTCCQNTDPCVFGRSFKYSNCRQRGPRCTLRNLQQGSLIAFMSMIQGVYYLDTIFVVDTSQEYSTDKTGTVNCSAEYRTLTLNRLPAHKNFRFYRGVTCPDNGKKVNALFSFTPSRLYSGLDNQHDFARCALDIDAINQAVGRSVFSGSYLQGIKQTLSIEQETWKTWKEIVRQMTVQGFVCGVNFDWPRRQA